MALFDNEAEKLRKKNLEKLEDKRVAFAKKLSAMNLTCEKALYAQTGGGFRGLALCGDKILYLTGPGPSDEVDFTVDVHPSVDARVERILIKGEGAGGFLGFGKKGGSGFRLYLTFPNDNTGEIEIVSSQNCFLEIEKGADPLFDLKRRRNNANFVWDFKTVDRGDLDAVLRRWLAHLGGEA